MALTKVGKEGVTGISNSSNATAITIDSSEKVGIGTTSPSSPLAVETGSIASLSTYDGHIVVGPSSRTSSSGDLSGGILFDQANGVQVSGKKGASITGVQDTSDVNSMGITFNVHGTDGSANRFEAMRIDTAGNLHVGKTATGIANAGLSLRGDADVAQFTRSGDAMLELNRLSNDGDLIIFYKDSSAVGSIGVNTDRVYLSTPNKGLAIDESGGTILPVNGSGSNNDNSIDLGASSVRFDDVFATNGTIQTSDANEKQQIASLTDAEITAAKAISALFKTFKWKNKVESKGDAARTHTGVIAQEVQTAMSNGGLDAANYAFWCSDTWWETSTIVPAVEADEEAGIEAKDAYTRIDTYQTAGEAPEGATQITRMGIRYPELLAFVGAATEQRLANIETRLTALEDA